MNKDEEMPGNPDIGFELKWRGNSKPKHILNQKVIWWKWDLRENILRVYPG